MQIRDSLKLIGLLIVFSLVISVSSYIFNTYFTSLSLNTNINKIYENELKKTGVAKKYPVTYLSQKYWLNYI